MIRYTKKNHSRQTSRGFELFAWLIIVFLAGVMVAFFTSQALSDPQTRKFPAEEQTPLLPPMEGQDVRPVGFPDPCTMEYVTCDDTEAIIRRIAEKKGISGDLMVALAQCESNGNAGAIGDNGNSRGLYQIHRVYWPEITDAEAFDPAWATEWTVQRVQEGRGYLWSCWEKVT